MRGAGREGRPHALRLRGCQMGMQAQMIHRMLFVLFWVFFQALSLLNGWGGLVGYLLAPLALAALLAGLVAAITRYAETVDDGDSLHPGS